MTENQLLEDDSDESADTLPDEIQFMLKITVYMGNLLLFLLVEIFMGNLEVLL